jgi:CDP-glycerol glycerophosphotransferase (TagB/SpsB family)
MKRYLLYICQNYAFEILRPLQREIKKRGDAVAWFVEGEDVELSLFDHNEVLLASIDEVKQFNPTAVFVPGNTVPNFIPGLKVQVFHGFEWKKKGHFRIRNCFDLYCTQGPLFTDKFNALKQAHPHFNVAETGWPKIDDLMSTPAYQWDKQQDLKTVLYAPTFSPSLTSAPALFETIKMLSSASHYQWLLKFHPKMDKIWVDRYRRIQSPYLHIIDDAAIAPVLKAADVMVSDTSSVITEFALLDKPIVTFNNQSPEDHLINIQHPNELQQSLDVALSNNADLLAKIQRHIATMHPFNDSQSSARVIDATLSMLDQGRGSLKQKPRNLIRSFKLRKKLNYWKIS